MRFLKKGVGEPYDTRCGVATDGLRKAARNPRASPGRGRSVPVVLVLRLVRGSRTAALNSLASIRCSVRHIAAQAECASAFRFDSESLAGGASLAHCPCLCRAAPTRSATGFAVSFAPPRGRGGASLRSASAPLLVYSTNRRRARSSPFAGLIPQDSRRTTRLCSYPEPRAVAIVTTVIALLDAHAIGTRSRRAAALSRKLSPLADTSGPPARPTDCPRRQRGGRRCRRPADD